MQSSVNFPSFDCPTHRIYSGCAQCAELGEIPFLSTQGQSISNMSVKGWQSASFCQACQSCMSAMLLLGLISAVSSSLYRLSSLTLTDLGRQSPKEQQLDLTLLPASLRVLNVSALRVDICALKHLKCLSITKLRFEWTCNTASEVYQLLQQLTLLQVSLL